MRRLYTVFIFLSVSIVLMAQYEIIDINNPSFEDIPHKGGGIFDIGIRGWYDCGGLQFPRETPPDVHPINAWKVTTIPSEGNSYLGMVVRDNDSWESISQRLRKPLEKGKCYRFSIDLSRSEFYVSASRLTNKVENYTEPAVLRLWGGTGVCGRQELLAESPTIYNQEWKNYQFELNPENPNNYFTVEAFYKVPVLFPYNGHLLLDNASKIEEIPCDGKDLLAQIEKITQEPSKIKPQESNRDNSVKIQEKEGSQTQTQDEFSIHNEKKTRSKIIAELDAKKIKEGQIIRVNNIYFTADSYSLEDKSNAVIEEIYLFLNENKNIVVEIGGHTSTVPSPKYCDNLSTNRAREVANALVRKGISPKRITYRGYGKRQPIIRNDKYDMVARERNQRVEIKILSLSYRETG